MDKKIKLITDIADMCAELDLVVGISTSDEGNSGIIIGKEDDVINSCKKLYGSDYEILGKTDEELATSDNIESFQFVELTEEEFEHFIESGELPEQVKVLNPKNSDPTLH